MGRDSPIDHRDECWGYNGIGTLLKAVEAEGCGVPARYFPTQDIPEHWREARRARSELSDSISWAFTLENVYPEFSSASPAKRRNMSIAEVYGQISRAIDRLKSDPTLKDLADAKLNRIDISEDLPEPVCVMDLLLPVQSAMDELRAEIQQVDRFVNKKYTKQNLLLTQLERSFRDGFDIEASATVTTVWGKHGRAFTAFVRATYAMAGKTVPSDDALKKAYRRLNLKTLGDNS